MPRTPIRLTLILCSLPLLLALPAPASAHGPAECVAGPARFAGSDRPHAVDPHGTDGSGLGAAGAALYGNAGDVIGAWIIGPSAWENRDSTANFLAVIRLEALDREPVLARYYVAFQGVGGERWVRAVYEGPDTWTFAYGTLNGTTFTSEGTTTGSIIKSNALIGIEIPKALLPARPADGTALTTDMTLARSYLRYPNGATTGALVQVDDATDFCPVTLYEAAPLA